MLAVASSFICSVNSKRGEEGDRVIGEAGDLDGVLGGAAGSSS